DFCDPVFHASGHGGESAGRTHFWLPGSAVICESSSLHSVTGSNDGAHADGQAAQNAIARSVAKWNDLLGRGDIGFPRPSVRRATFELDSRFVPGSRRDAQQARMAWQTFADGALFLVAVCVTCRVACRLRGTCVSRVHTFRIAARGKQAVG